jgi:hypothetical protein
VQVGWSPYHNGHWGWVGAYGWTWIDDAPWGFAPFHYGRWAYIGNRWGWCPGPVGVRPYYAPALVAFVGGGVGFSVGGPIGWFALGPRDVYFPSYRVSRGYFTNINSRNTVINNTVINNYYGNYSRGNVNYGQINYANRNIAGAVTAVPAAAFIGSRPVAGAAIAVNARTFANARVSGFAAVAPTRASLAPAIAARGRPGAAVLNRPIVAATRPPAPVASFAQRQTLLDKNPGRPLNERELRAPVVAAGAVAGAAAVGIAARRNVNVVTQHGAPVRAAAPALPARAGAAELNPHAAPVSRANPVTRPATNVSRPNAITTPNRPAAAATEQPRHLDSSRFAHPGASPAPTRENAAQRPVQVAPARAATPSEGARSTAPANRQEYRKPTPQPVAPPRQEYHQATPQRETVAPPRQEYHQPTPQPAAPARQEYRQAAPQREAAPPRQEYHAPVQQQRSVQEYQRPAPRQEAPRQAAPAPAHSREPEKKDDDKKHGG